MSINPTRHAGTGTAQVFTVADVAATTETVNLGNGITVDLDANDVAGEQTIKYTHSGNSVSSNANASTFLTGIQTALDTVASGLQKVGSMVARLGIKEENITTAKINVESAANRIMNADMAFEQLEATKFQIIQQTATAMLSQANNAPQNILSLFR